MATLPTKCSEFVGFLNIGPQSSGKVVSLPDISAGQGVVSVGKFVDVGDEVTVAGSCTWGLTPVLTANSLESCWQAIAQLRATYFGAIRMQ